MTGCAECQSILVGYDATSLAFGIPPLYDITPAGGMDETFTFLPGTYMTETISIPFDSYEVKVSPETTPTPEPPTILLLTVAALGGLLIKRRALTQM